MKHNIWDQTPPLCKHGDKKTTRVTTLAREDEAKPRKQLLVTPPCGRKSCPIQMYEVQKDA